jgi:2-isopropylmalate synthase/UPF0716 protein FxsA
VIYFFIYLFLEIVVSVEISSIIGGLNTFFEVIFSSIVGIYIISNYKNIMLSNVRDLFQGKINDIEFLENNIFPFAGAVLLIVPGFLTDFIGIFLQFRILTSVFINFFMTQPDVPLHVTSEEQKDFYKTQNSDREFSVTFGNNKSSTRVGVFKPEEDINLTPKNNQKQQNKKDFIDAEIIEPKKNNSSNTSSN